MNPTSFSCPIIKFLMTIFNTIEETVDKRYNFIFSVLSIVMLAPVLMNITQRVSQTNLLNKVHFYYY